MKRSAGNFCTKEWDVKTIQSVKKIFPLFTSFQNAFKSKGPLGLSCNCHSYTHVRTNGNIHACTYTCTCTCTHTCTHARKHTCTHTHTHTLCRNIMDIQTKCNPLIFSSYCFDRYTLFLRTIL